MKIKGDNSYNTFLRPVAGMLTTAVYVGPVTINCYDNVVSITIEGNQRN